MENASMRANGQAAMGRQSKSRKIKPRHIFVSAATMILIFIIVLSAIFFYRNSTGASIDGGEYQALFLTNGQVYFGKLQTLNSEYMKMTDIFYLQAKTGTSSTNPQATTNQQSTDVQLIKLGSEVHGPEDQMIISKSQILFFENLKKDGKVSDSINTYIKQNK
jgi:hypothetical protein